jgi:hypothetical protein
MSAAPKCLYHHVPMKKIVDYYYCPESIGGHNSKVGGKCPVCHKQRVASYMYKCPVSGCGSSARSAFEGTPPLP